MSPARTKSSPTELDRVTILSYPLFKRVFKRVDYECEDTLAFEPAIGARENLRAKGRLKEGVIPVYLNQHENEPIYEPICTVGYEHAPLCPSRRRTKE